MLGVGESAPTFTVPIAYGDSYDDIGEFSLADELGDGPIVLAFFPAAFTGGCTEEMCTFRDSLAAFEEIDARVYGLSVDLPFALNVFIQRHDLTFPILSDFDRDVIHAYDAIIEDLYGLSEVADRAVFVIDDSGTITYAWAREGDENPDFDTFVDDVRDAAAATRQ
ncbi:MULTISPECIES: redoxin domain-containing protein [Salinibaculum]|uniref:redoxin domain-containing protein n=1 Tax=Salinibaculum TaxID=2732368 RepID=UPI0030D5FB9C